MSEPEPNRREQIAKLWKDVAAPADGPVHAPGKYRIVKPLGSGGSASVYLAEDSTLKRPVALKVLKLIDPAGIARFRREALMAAALDHPNIVKIYEAGEEDGQAYIAMQYVSGEPIDDRRLSLPESLRAVQKIAEALHHAHSKGMLHRDVKPGNILVDERGEVYLTDFGLARETQGPGVSLSGSIVGTPAYMSPEQARGAFREMDARSDVYSLGASLYELVTGRAPLDGETTYYVLQSAVACEIPAPSRINHGLPRDVEIMILKAMAPEKERRYRSAKEFADDIGRYLSGEAIQARPASVAYRMTRFVKRRPAWVTFVVAGLVALGLGAALWIQRQRASDAEAQAKKAREEALTMMRRISSGATDAILTARRRGEGVHVVREAMQRALREAYDEALQQAPDLAEPEYLMGRVERALMRNADAERFQERALAKDPNFAPALYEMIVLLSRRYARELEDAKRKLQGDRVVSASGGVIEAHKLKDLKEPTREEVEKSKPGLADLRERIQSLSQKFEAGDVRLGEATILSGRGIAAAYLGQGEKGKKLLQDAVARDSTLEEAFETLARISPSWEEAERWYTEGLKHDAGYLGHWIGRGSIRSQRANRLREREGGPLEMCRAAEEDFQRALTLSPDCIDGWLGRGSICINRAAYLSTRAQDAMPDLAQAVEFLTRAIELDARCAEALIKRAGAFANKGIFKSNRGENPMDDFNRSEADFTRALEIEPDNWEAWNWVGSMHASRAYYNSQFGRDPTDDYKRAEAEFKRVIELNQNHPEAWAHRGYVRAGLASYKFRKAGDPTDDYRQADEDFEQAVKLYPNSPLYWTLRGDLFSSWTSYQQDHGKDSSREFKRAEECYTRAIEINGEFARAYSRRGSLRSGRAVARMTRGEDPQSDIEQADRDLKRSLELHPRDTDALSFQGRMYANLAYYKHRQGHDATEEIARMEESYTRGLQIKPDSAEHFMGRGFGRTIAGLNKVLGGGDPLEEWKRAEGDFAAALTYRPENGWIYFCRAELRFNRALYWERQGDKAREGREYADVVDDFEKAVKLAPKYEPLIRPRLAQARKKAVPEY